MPAKSKAQQRLMAAAEHGATFSMAQKVRASMTKGALSDFASGSMAGKPVHVGSHPHRNLGKWLHPKKSR
jgi:hypothetical protein